MESSLHIFVYSIWSGELRVYEGDMHLIRPSWRSQMLGENLEPRVGIFKNAVKRFECSTNPGVVHNKIVWLPERDDDKARQILIAYEETQIAKLQEKIQNHQAKINTLKEGPIYG